MEIRLNTRNTFRLSLAGVLVAADLVEGRPRYHLHNHVSFEADLAHGKYTISSYTTSSATSRLSQAITETRVVWDR